jgi:hypothetical protein
MCEKIVKKALKVILDYAASKKNFSTTSAQTAETADETRNKISKGNAVTEDIEYMKKMQETNSGRIDFVPASMILLGMTLFNSKAGSVAATGSKKNKSKPTGPVKNYTWFFHSYVPPDVKVAPPTQDPSAAAVTVIPPPAPTIIPLVASNRFIYMDAVGTGKYKFLKITYKRLIDDIEFTQDPATLTQAYNLMNSEMNPDTTRSTGFNSDDFFLNFNLP